VVHAGAGGVDIGSIGIDDAVIRFAMHWICDVVRGVYGWAGRKRQGIHDRLKDRRNYRPGGGCIERIERIFRRLRQTATADLRRNWSSTTVLTAAEWVCNNGAPTIFTLSDVGLIASVKSSLTTSSRRVARGLQDGAKAFLLNAQPVDGWMQVGDDVYPDLVCSSDGRDVGLDVGDLAFGADDHGSGQIRHPAGNSGAFFLCGNNNTEERRKITSTGYFIKILPVC
jgi:hypothetical protein